MGHARTLSSQDRTLATAARLADRAVPWALGLALAAFTLLDYHDAHHGLPEHLVIVLFSAGSGLAAATARHRLWPLLATLVPASFLFAWWPAFIIASYYAATTLRRGTRLAVFACLSTVALLGLPSLYDACDLEFALSPADPVSALDGIFAVLFLVVLPLVVGLWISARRQVLAGLAERAARMERDHATRTEQARAAERARIAREMHDVVAHKVSLIVLHAGALEVGTSDPDARHTAELIRATGREALTNLREVLGVLRSPPPDLRAPLPGLADLDRLLDQSRSTGLPVHRQDEGTARPLPATAERAAYRVVQEALTNIHKHTAKATTEVVVRYRPDHLQLTVSNAPSRTPAEPWPGAGHGLIGLRERLEMLGGRLDAGPRPDGGFTVHARIPTAEEPA